MVPEAMMLYAVPFVTLLIVWEIYQYHVNKRPFPWKEAVISMLMALVYTFVNSSTAPFLARMNEWFAGFRLFDIPSNTVWGFGLLFLAVEFAYYWLHRCGHEIRWLWASHNVHHSPKTVTFSGAYRLSITAFLSGFFLFFVPLLILGFSPQAVTAMYGMNLIYQFWLHTEWIPKLGWFEYIFNTPSHHRVHHATNPEYIDHNYGGILIIFDRLFGTFVEEKASVPLTYGLLGKEPTLNPLKLFFQEWVALFRDVAQANSWRDRFFLAFGRPGWQPGVRNTAASLQEVMPVDDTLKRDVHEARNVG